MVAVAAGSPVENRDCNAGEHGGSEAFWRRSRKNRYAWLPFLDTHRTMCLAPQPDFRRVLAGVLAMELAA
jgi:hypothetical protein